MVKKTPIDIYSKKLPLTSLLENYDEPMTSDEYLELIGQSKTYLLNNYTED